MSRPVEDPEDDPWSGYQETLELESTPRTGESVSAQALDALFDSQVADEFAAAEARLQARGQQLHEQQLAQQAQRQRVQQLMNNHFPHLQTPGVNYHAGTLPMTRTTPALVGVATTPFSSPQPARNPVAAPLMEQPSTLPYELDAWGNPILPEGASLDYWGQIVYES